MTICRSCGKQFTGTQAFDEHRTGTYSPDRRRCRTTAEMHALGWYRAEAGLWPRRPPKRLL